MGTGTGSDVAERRLMMLCSRVERLLRLALSDWYGYLSRESLTVETWRHGVPWWVKRIPSRLSIDWALYELRKFCVVPGMLDGLVTTVDEIVMSLDRESELLENTPDMSVLRDALSELSLEIGSVYGVGV